MDLLADVCIASIWNDLFQVDTYNKLCLQSPELLLKSNTSTFLPLTNMFYGLPLMELYYQLGVKLQATNLHFYTHQDTFGRIIANDYYKVLRAWSERLITNRRFPQEVIMG